MKQVVLRDVCSQAREQIRPGERTDLKYVGLESVEAGTGAFVEGELSKTPEDPRAVSFHFDTRHVLYGKLRPYLNKVVAPNFEGKCSTELVPLLPGESLDRQYLAYFLRSKATVDAIVARTAGARMPRADMNHLLGLSIPLPTLPEQKLIVDLLSRAEGIVRLRREAQRKAAELVPALFLDMFGDPASNPKGWQMYRIDELLERFEGGKNLQAGDDESATYRILKISAVTSGRYIESESKPAPNDLIPAQSHFVRTGDLLISRANTDALVGATAIVDRTDGRTLLPDKLWRFVWRSDTAIEPRFALHLFQQPAIRNKLSQLASGTGGSMKNISQAKLKTLELPVPPIELQRQFAAKADAVRGIAAQQAAALATAQATFDALLHQSFAVS